MKKIFLTVALCSMIILSGCGEKKKTTQVPKSVKTYQQLNLTPEQNKKLSAIRAAQRTKMDAIRKEMDENRKLLPSASDATKLTAEQRKANLEKYRAAFAKSREKLQAERDSYDKAFMNILDSEQKATYQKYLDQREQEKVAREKQFKKTAKK